MLLDFGVSRGLTPCAGQHNTISSVNLLFLRDRGFAKISHGKGLTTSFQDAFGEAYGAGSACALITRVGACAGQWPRVAQPQSQGTPMGLRWCQCAAALEAVGSVSCLETLGLERERNMNIPGYIRQNIHARNA